MTSRSRARLTRGTEMKKELSFRPRITTGRDEARKTDILKMESAVRAEIRRKSAEKHDLPAIRIKKEESWISGGKVATVVTEKRADSGQGKDIKATDHSTSCPGKRGGGRQKYGGCP